MSVHVIYDPSVEVLQHTQKHTPKTEKTENEAIMRAEESSISDSPPIK